MVTAHALSNHPVIIELCVPVCCVVGVVVVVVVGVVVVVVVAFHS